MRAYLVMAVLTLIPLATTACAGCGTHSAVGSCARAADCQEGQTCLDNGCHNSCQLPGECLPSESCYLGACLVIARACSSGDDCASFELCSESSCRVVCTAASQCPLAHQCAAGICLPDSLPDAGPVDTAAQDRQSAEAGRADAAATDVATSDSAMRDIALSDSAPADVLPVGDAHGAEDAVLHDAAVAEDAPGVDIVEYTEDAGPVQYDWQLGSWSECTLPCGGGVQMRTVACLDLLNAVSAEVSHCPGEAPATSQACNEQLCTHVWVVAGSWSTCSEPCGSGVQTRSVLCLEIETSTVVVDGRCEAGTKPSTAQSCNEQRCTYLWQVTPWSVCSSLCGPGTATRAVNCQQVESGDFVDSDPVTSPCAASSAKPATSQSCNVQDCTAYVWLTSDWSACAPSCGNGTQARNVSCYDRLASATVHHDLCEPQLEPANSQACSGPSCYAWIAGTWSACSALCEGGAQNRSMNCTRIADNLQVADVECAALAKPPVTQACNSQLCTYQWIAEGWALCSARCNGTRTRNVRCHRVEYQDDVATNKCPAATKPTTSDACDAQHCSNGCSAAPGVNCGGACTARTESSTLFNAVRNGGVGWDPDCAVEFNSSTCECRIRYDANYTLYCADWSADYYKATCPVGSYKQ